MQYDFKKGTYIMVDREHEVAKIGCATNIEKRLIRLQIANAFLLEVVMWLPNENIEKELQRRFKHLLIRGEWFHYKEDLRDYAETYPEPHVGQKKRKYDVDAFLFGPQGLNW